MKRKLLIVFMTIICALCLAFALTACGGGSSDSNSNNSGNNGNNTDQSQQNDDNNGGNNHSQSDSNSDTTPSTSHTHDLTKTERVEATCTTEGNIAYWYCSGCGKYFSDEAATAEITEDKTVIAALGHTYGSDDLCTVCHGHKPTEGLSYTYSYYSYYVSVGTATDTEIYISDTYDDGTNGSYPVTSIGYAAFSDCTSLTSITIPESVTYIEGSAFDGCSSLTSITLPDSVTSIGNEAFRGCSSLTSVTIPDSVTSIDNYTFENCSSLTSITLPDGVTYIGNGAFEYCTALTNITIPESVTSIGYVAFCGCTALTNITIPDGVTSIGEWAFEGCSSLESITIPDSVTSIGERAFEDCSSLESITIPDSVTSISGYAFSGCTALTSVTIPNSVQSIGFAAFDGCSSLTSITMPESVTSISGYTFEGCSSLTSVTIPESVTSIGSGAFKGCSSLISITIPESVTSIGDYTFEGCSSLISITIPESVTSIGYRAFRDCYILLEVYNLSSLEITAGSSENGYVGYYAKNVYTSKSDTNNVITQDDYIFYNDNGTYYLMLYRGSDTELTLPALTVNGGTVNYSIYKNLFYGNTEITDITIGSSVTSIGQTAFYGCTSLTNITIGSSITSIGNSAFSNTAYYEDDSNWTDGVLYIGNYLIRANSGVSNNYTIKDATTVIADYAFYVCTSLTSVTIPDGVTSIGNYAFSYCYSLTSVTLPDSITTIGDYAFTYCTKLTSINNMPSTAVYNINIFDGCDKFDMLSLAVSSNGGKYLANELVAIEDKNAKYFIVNEGTTSIAENVFADCTALRFVYIPASVTEIGDGALKFASTSDNCTTEIFFESSNGSSSISTSYSNWLGTYAAVKLWGTSTTYNNIYYSCVSSCCLADGYIYTVSNGEATIYAYYGEDTAVTVPATLDNNTVVGISGYAFAELEITSVTLPSSCVTIGGDLALTGVGTVAYVPFGWCANLTTVTFAATNVDIEAYSFYNCTALTSVNFGSAQMAQIMNNAFDGCTSLQSVTLPEMLMISQNIFNGCTALTSVTAGSGANVTITGYVTANGQSDYSASIEIANGANFATALKETYASYYYLYVNIDFSSMMG